MAILPRVPQQQWITLEGTIGEFTAPGSQAPVMHLSTFASLGDDGTGSTRLTRDLLPVREMFEVGELNFDELLQRDLDDYRVATDIIPYLLRNTPMVRFFPPILAVVVPVQNKRVVDFYPAPKRERREHPEARDYEEITDTYGGCLQLVRTSYQGTYTSAAQLKFNPDQARLVIIDGQHRAMAMLAIRREKTGDWGDKGRDFKHFYEDLATELHDAAVSETLDKIQMPVCICFFSTLFEKDGQRPQYTTVQCCRKLFLDVNKNAKRPTKARQLLLDDANLLSAITRSILTLVREEGRPPRVADIELDAFEYDTPKDSPTPTRDLSICTVEMLRQLIYWAGFGKHDFYTNLKRRKLQGRLAEPDKERFKEEVRFDTVSKAEMGDWGYGNFEKEFEPNDCRTLAQPRLVGLFNETWGRVIIDLLGQLHPYRAHHRAVADLRAAHQSETGHGALAYRALFDGQGVLWTLSGYVEHRKDQRKELSKQGQKLPEVQMEKAYRAIKGEWIPREFVPTRTAYFLNKKSKDMVTEADKNQVARSYETLLTQAFQVGILMAVAYLKKKLRLKEPAVFHEAASQWINAFNQVMQRDAGFSMFDREGQGFMSCYFGGLQPTDWYWFRYFTFEMLAQSKLSFPGKKEAQEAAEACRGVFIEGLMDEIIALDKKLGKTTTKAEAEFIALGRWRDALKHAVGLNKADFDSWAKNRSSKTVATAAEAESDDIDGLDSTDAAE